MTADRRAIRTFLLVVLLCWILSETFAVARAAEIDLTKAVIVTPANLGNRETKAVQMLFEEVEKRTTVRWKMVHDQPAHNAPSIVIVPNQNATHFRGTEGFRLLAEHKRVGPTVMIAANDARGLLFGVGRLLRELRMTKGRVILPGELNIATAPKYPIRGHQLGYRPKTNSYDAWSLPMWEQYIRDLVVFGANAVELIPPRSDDASKSPHFPLPPMEMMIGMSKLCDDYGLDVWIWYPALDANYGDPKTVEFALKEWGEVFKRLPRIDAIFVPGGDPGHTRPKHLFALLEKQTENLRRYHPKAQMWMSPQSFNREWMNEFYEIMNRQPAWLGGIVHGPQVRVSLPELRAALPAKYPIRRYPDITHSMRCQYPVPGWDLAYAITEAREVINPRPIGQAQIFHAYKDSAAGFITYSEGCNDDVNKAVWSALGWNPDEKIADILRQYSGYFISERYRDDFAEGLLALEKNWQGPLLTNEAVYETLKRFQVLEKSATPAELLNWRFQQALYRAYYDAYERSRLIHETALEEQAMNKLRSAGKIGSVAAMSEAEAILEKAETERVAGEWRTRVHVLAEALFQSIRMQLSVPKYKAISVGRGATLDTLDVPLNNRLWLKKEFAAIREASTESDRLRRIETIINWTKPGPGGFYDDLGDPANQPHLVSGLGFAKDPGSFQSPALGFEYSASWRKSWVTHADGLYDFPLKMQYNDLDPKAAYKIRITYAGDKMQTRVKLTADETTEVHPLVRKAVPIRPVEFDIPRTATADGKLTLTWSQDPGAGGPGRGIQVAEVWLMKK